MSIISGAINMSYIEKYELVSVHDYKLDSKQCYKLEVFKCLDIFKGFVYKLDSFPLDKDENFYGQSNVSLFVRDNYFHDDKDLEKDTEKDAISVFERKLRELFESKKY